MKKTLLILMTLAALLAAGTGLRAQEVTITLMPGWTWISYPNTEAMAINDALAGFTPVQGDIVKSQYASSRYVNGRWLGGITHFIPGVGYMYYSAREDVVSLVFAQTTSSSVMVTTTEPTSVTAVSASVGGEAVSVDGTYILVKGICWATHPIPTSNDSYFEFGSGEGSFTATWSNLEINTTYYVRAYAVTPHGTTYGEQQVFTTRDGIPSVTTMDITGIRHVSAVGGGTISDDGGLSVNTCGICWSMDHNPTINDSHTSNIMGDGCFTNAISGLAPNITYYVRAYATNNYTTAYGEEKMFTTLGQVWDNGVLPGVFSVSATQQVNFSQGNLQYIGSADTPYWKFADEQWFCFGTSAGNFEASQRVDRDLFAWGTSGYNHGAVNYQPWSMDVCDVWCDTWWDRCYFDADYLAYGGECNLYEQTGQADWGYNAISNGGDEENIWFTLSQSEWDYVLNERNTNSGIRFAKARVENVDGLLLLPDDWNTSAYDLNNTNNTRASFDSNIITLLDWVDSFEANGAVFLPIGGTRGVVYHDCDMKSNEVGNEKENNSHLGMYWSSSHYRTTVSFTWEEGQRIVHLANAVYFSNNWMSESGDALFSANSVRLVKPIQPRVVSTGLINITESTAVCNGRIVNSLVDPVTECGFCWSTHPNPSTADNVAIVSGVTTGAFSYELTNLVQNTKYYVRAYATNGMGTGYGNEMCFVCRNAPTGAVNGLFSVSSDAQVYFSQGNLQYQASTDTWKFAEHQYDYVGNDNSNISATYSGWIDLFGWGTSGWNCGNVYYHPWDSNNSDIDYSKYGPVSNSLIGIYANADWGVYNPISNGGNTATTWCTLSSDDWDYLLNQRVTTSGIRFAKSRVHGEKGVILLPDYWNSAVFALNNTNNAEASFDGNVISDSDWTLMETNGAVFLPAAGFRDETTVTYPGAYGGYWTTTWDSYSKAKFFRLVGPSLGVESYYRSRGYSVRLVYRVTEEASSHTITVSSSAGGTVTGGGTYTQGQSCTVTATANEGFVFVNWTENGSVVSTNPTYSFMVNDDRTLVANFRTSMSYIDGKFTINENGDQIYFSRGNLQYQASTGTWRFADNQYDYVGSSNSNISSTYSGWIDLFGWGTSGYNHGSICYQPWSTSNDEGDYHVYGSSSYNLNDQTGQADWGYNSISNGGSQLNQWRTLTQSEWEYIIKLRNTSSGIRYAKARVANVNGVILLPDDWNSNNYNLYNVNTTDASYNSNVISASHWLSLEAEGAVFLPVTGFRVDTSVGNLSDGYYWSTTKALSTTAYSLSFGTSYLYYKAGKARYHGQCVRLIRTVE